jgi:hypothetical protein
MGFSDATYLSALWTFTLPISWRGMLGPLSTTRLLSGAAWK